MRFLSAKTTEAPCPKKCAACENGTCLKCDKGFALFSSAKRDSKFCIPCARAAKAGKFANSDKSQCQGIVCQCNKQLFTFNTFNKQTNEVEEVRTELLLTRRGTRVTRREINSFVEKRKAIRLQAVPFWLVEMVRS